MGLDIAPFRRAGFDLSLAAFEEMVMHAVEDILPAGPAPDARAELSHPRREGADPGQHEPVTALQRARIGADVRPGTDVLERLLNGAAVAHPVIDHADQGAHRVPFVLGTPLSSGSMATAVRSARASALKAASIM